MIPTQPIPTPTAHEQCNSNLSLWAIFSNKTYAHLHIFLLLTGLLCRINILCFPVITRSIFTNLTFFLFLIISKSVIIV